LRERGGKGTKRIFRLIPPCSYFLSAALVFGAVEVVVVGDDVDELDVLLSEEDDDEDEDEELELELELDDFLLP
jgi:hypothetical protein